MQGPDAAAADAGFTLVEAIVSFVVLATVLGSVTLSLSYSARLQRQGEAKRTAMGCAQHLLAERFDTRGGLPDAESGTNGDDCRWRILRHIAKAFYTESGRNLMSFRLEILNPRGDIIEAFDTYYVEDIR